jgi:hypothetical protein
VNQKVKEYIAKQSSPQKEILQKLRKIILKAFPDIKEEMKWGVPVYKGGKYYIGSLRDSVNMGFSVKGMPEKDKKLFKGSGKFMRHIKIRTLQEIDEKQIVKLMKLVQQADADCHH